MMLDILQAYGLVSSYIDPYAQTWIKILCPFHPEKTPSCSVHIHTGQYKCFGCDAKGKDEVDFIIRLEKTHGYPNIPQEFISWKALVFSKQLAQHSEIVQHPINIDPFTALSDESKLEMSQDFFNSLSRVDWRDEELKMNYLLTERHMSSDVLIREDVRLNPTSEYPIVIPVIEQGEFVGYTMRRVSDGDPKYLHSEGFQKNKHYYGTLKKGPVALVEGPLDRWRMLEYGFLNVACTFGWACSLMQLDKILEYATEIIVAYDNDAAGKRGYDKVKQLTRVLAERMHVLRLQFPKKRKDPCDLLKNELILPCYVWE